MCIIDFHVLRINVRLNVCCNLGSMKVGGVWRRLKRFANSLKAEE